MNVSIPTFAELPSFVKRSYATVTKVGLDIVEAPAETLSSVFSSTLSFDTGKLYM